MTYKRSPSDDERADILRSQGASDDDVARLFPNASKPKRARRSSKTTDDSKADTDEKIDVQADANAAGLASAVTVEKE